MYRFLLAKKRDNFHTSTVLAAPSVIASGQEYKPDDGQNINSFAA